MIDRQSVSVSIVRTICNLSRKIDYTTSVTDEQNDLSLCPPEDRTNLVVVRFRFVFVMHTHSLSCVMKGEKMVW